MEKEYKAFPFKIGDVGDSGEFKGYASTFGNVDYGNDTVIAGAFSKTLLESDGGKVPILDHHDPARQIGWNLEAKEDRRGLLVHGKLDLNVQLARERHSLMRMASAVGARTGLSIGYKTVKAETNRANPGPRKLRELKLYEYSIVVFPMNPEAGVNTVKSTGSWMRHFLQGEFGLDPERAEQAAEFISGLLAPAKQTQSPSAVQLLPKLNQVLYQIQNHIQSLQ
jgi:hypothetical protein